MLHNYRDSYSFGDAGYTSIADCPAVISFDAAVAQAIGNSFAIVNIESEWDTSVPLAIFQGPGGVQCFQQRIQQYNAYAPNALITSAPGLWNSWGTYTFFQPVEQMLNLRALNINAVNSGNTTCSLKYDGSYWTSGELSLAAAQSYIDSKINGDLTTMNMAWGKSQNDQWLAFSAATTCGWGPTGQAQILSKIVNVSSRMFQDWLHVHTNS